AEVRGIEHVLAAHAQDELASDREHGGARGQRRRARPEKQAEGKAGDQRALWIEAPKTRGPAEHVLGEETDPDEEGRRGRTDVEVQDEEAEGEQSREGRDLVRTRIHVAATSEEAISFRRGGRRGLARDGLQASESLLGVARPELEVEGSFRDERPPPVCE